MPLPQLSQAFISLQTQALNVAEQGDHPPVVIMTPRIDDGHRVIHILDNGPGLSSTQAYREGTGIG